MMVDYGRYVRAERTCRSSGARVMIFDTQAPENEFDPDGGRWVTFCDTHSTLCNHRTLRQAEQFLPWPANWCEPCAAQRDAD
jgi:hypothetical protein